MMEDLKPLHSSTMSYRLVAAGSFLQTCMFVFLVLQNARLEERLRVRLAAMEAALIDLRVHCEAK